MEHFYAWCPGAAFYMVDIYERYDLTSTHHFNQDTTASPRVCTRNWSTNLDEEWANYSGHGEIP